MDAKDLQRMSAHIKRILHTQNVTDINPELEMIDGVLWLIDESSDTQIFTVTAPTVDEIQLDLMEWCKTIPRKDGGVGIACF